VCVDKLSKNLSQPGLAQRDGEKHSHDDRTHEGTKIDTNKAVIRSFVDAWNTRDYDRFTSLI